jgi:hypothetical protein
VKRKKPSVLRFTFVLLLITSGASMIKPMDEKAKEAVAIFIRQMKENHANEVAGIDLPPGMNEYVEERIREGDLETILFMMKLGYIMGLQTGVAVGQEGEPQKPTRRTFGPMQA